MSKRNLALEVRPLIGHRFVIVILAIVITSSGCSGIKSNGFRDWINPQSTADNWDREQAEIPRRAYAADRRLAESMEATTDPQPLSSSPPVHVHDSATGVCDHPDCNLPRVVPKLAFAEPIDYPVTINTPPPSGSQSLLPMLLNNEILNNETRAVKTAARSNVDVANKWQTENPADLPAKRESNPTAAALAKLPEGPNPIRIKSPVARATNATINERETVEAKVTGLEQTQNSTAVSSISSTLNPAPQDAPLTEAVTTQSSRIDRVRINEPNVQAPTVTNVSSTPPKPKQAELPNPIANDQLIKVQLIGIKVDPSQFEFPKPPASSSASAPTSAIPRVVAIPATSTPSKPAVAKTPGGKSPDPQALGNDFRPTIEHNGNGFIPTTPGATASLPIQDPAATVLTKSAKPTQSANAESVAKTTLASPLAKGSGLMTADLKIEQRAEARANTATGLKNQTQSVKPTGSPAALPAIPPSNSKPAAGFVVPVGYIETVKPSPDLKLSHAQFCTEIKGFGQVTPFSVNCFQPKQQTLVYCEVENYHSILEKNSDGATFVTRLRGRFTIDDQRGNVVQSGEFPDIEDVTTRQRRDFYMYFPVTLQNLPAGEYQLSLTVDELTGSGSEKSAAVKPTIRSTSLEPKITFSVQ